MSNLLSQASLVMIPSGYKEDVVYSQIPTDGSGDLSFTRASNGTRVNSAGLVEVCPWNLLQQSEAIGVVSPWANSNLTITANSVIAPNGTTTADVLTETTATTTQFRTQQTTPQSTNIYTLSVYVKNITGTRQAYIDLGPVTGFFNFATETTYSASAIASFENVGNGWYRFSLTTATAITPSTIYMGLGQSNSETYTGNGTSAIAFWGAQLNIGSTAKPYFPTTDRLNVPRLTYQNGGGGCPSLLLEKQSTNISNQSEDFASWPTQVNVTPTANYATSPDGTQNADRIQFTGAGFMYGANGYSQTSGVVYTLSCWAKRNGSGSQSVGFFVDGSGTINSAWSLSSEYQRFTYTYTAGNSSLVGIAGASGADVSVWGWQFEASSYPTSYIPTTSSSATRVADKCFKTGISSLIGQTEGTLYFELQRDNTDNDSRLQISDGTTNNWLFVSIESGIIPRIYCNVGGVNQFSAYGSTLDNNFHKLALAYKNNDFKLYVDGVASITQTSGSVPTCSRLDVANTAPTNDVQSPSQIKEAILFKTRLTNAELASLTTL